MRWFKVAAVVVGIFIAFSVVSALMGYLIMGAIGALVIAAIVLAVKVTRSRREVSWDEPDKGLGERSKRRQKKPNVDHELARLKREMRN